MSYISDSLANLEQRRRERKTAGALPAYAFPYQHPAAQKGDVGAEFRGDDGGCITVGIERTEMGMLLLQTGRSGLGENCFTKNELARVLELAGILFAANGKQPERGKI